MVIWHKERRRLNFDHLSVTDENAHNAIETIKLLLITPSIYH